MRFSDENPIAINAKATDKPPASKASMRQSSASAVDDQTYAFRDEMGRPLWAGGRGKGRGGNNQ